MNLRSFHRIGGVSSSTLSAGGQSYEIFRLEGAERLPYTLRILLENALRHGEEDDAEALRRWQPTAAPSDEISFRPARVLLVRSHTIPKTSSGKIQHAALAARIAAGVLADQALHETGSAGG